MCHALQKSSDRLKMQAEDFSKEIWDNWRDASVSYNAFAKKCADGGFESWPNSKAFQQKRGESDISSVAKILRATAS